MSIYASMLFKGNGVEANIEKAARYFKLACDKSEINDIYNYALMLYDGLVFTENKEEACRLKFILL